jgi:hypothetical protein
VYLFEALCAKKTKNYWIIVIYYYYYFLWHCSPARIMASSSTRFLDHTQGRATVGRTPLNEWDNIYKKAVPLQALTGPEGSRRLRIPHFMTIGT